MPPISNTNTSVHKPSPSEAVHVQHEDVMAHFKHILKKNYTTKDTNTRNAATLKMYRDNMNKQEHIASLQQTISIISNDENLFEYKFASVISSMPKQAKVAKDELTDWFADFYFLHRDMAKVCRSLQISPPSIQNTRSNAWFNEMIVWLENRYESGLEEAAKQAKQKSSTLLAGEHMTLEERKREFEKDGGTKAPNGMNICPMCQHEYVDQPACNAANKAANEKAYSDYQQAYEEYENAARDTKKKKKKKDVNVPSKPKAPALKPLLLRCHCSQYKFSVFDRANTCPIKCKDKNGNKYTEGNCPICECQCSFLWKMSDTAKIVAEIAASKEKAASSSAKEQAIEFLTNIHSAKDTAKDTALNALHRDKLEGKLAATDTEIAEVAEETGYLAGATYALSNSLSHDQIMFFQNQFKNVAPNGRQGYIEVNGQASRLANIRASKQRYHNNGLQGQVEVEVIDMTSEKEESDKEDEGEVMAKKLNDMSRLKKKALNDLKGTPNTKKIGQKMFRKIHEMSKDDNEYEIMREMAEGVCNDDNFDSQDTDKYYSSLKKAAL